MATSILELASPSRGVPKIRDPRAAQLAILSALLAYGAFFLGFVKSPGAVPAALLAAVLVECAWSAGKTRRSAEPRPSAAKRFGAAELLGSGRMPSALISALSTLLLFRAESPWTYAAVVALALSSKRLIRFRGRHFVNPTNGAVLLGSLVLPGWIASGQWGHSVLFAFVLGAGALVVLTPAARLDTALAFLGGTAGALALRILVYGYPWPTLGHAFTSGTLWLFALFMITDPKTTPRDRTARIAHGAWVAALAVALQQAFYVRHAFLWALLASAPLVPLLDHITASRLKGDHR